MCVCQTVEYVTFHYGRSPLRPLSLATNTTTGPHLGSLLPRPPRLPIIPTHPRPPIHSPLHLLSHLPSTLSSPQSLFPSLPSFWSLPQVKRVGPSHQAGSDSLVTSLTFFKMARLFFENNIDESKYSGVLYGLGQGSGSGTTTWLAANNDWCSIDTLVQRNFCGPQFWLSLTSMTNVDAGWLFGVTQLWHVSLSGQWLDTVCL